MKKLYVFLWFLLSFSFAFGQIYQPEGINMPGEWNSWQNPPANKPHFASDSQVVGGGVHLVEGLANKHYQTMFNTFAGGDTTAGTYQFLFTSGPTSNIWQNKWGGVKVQLFTIQTYTYQGVNDTITLGNNRFYVVNFEDNGYADTRAVFFELGDTATHILNVSQTPDTLSVLDGQSVTVDITLEKSLDLEESVIVRYTTDNWATDSMIICSDSANIARAVIPPQPQGTVVSYYVFTTAHPNIQNFTDPRDIDLLTIYFDNNNGQNYSYTVQASNSTSVPNEDNESVLVYPNPAQDIINVANAAGYRLDITDLSGRVLKSFVRLSSNQQINVSDIQPGIYLFKFSGNGKSFVKKVSIR